MDKLKSMKIFLKIVDTGNFTEAAKQLKIPLASVSYYISKLEESLGIRLLNRTTRKVSLTDLGRSYAERCRYILAEIEETENTLIKLNNEPEGMLNINASISFGVLYLSEFISEFMSLYPKVHINLNLADHFVNVMEEGADIVIRISQPVDSSFRIRKLAPVNIIFCASPEYLNKHGEPGSLSELSQHNCLQYRYYQGQNWRATGPDGQEKIKTSGNLHSNNDEILKSAACDGQGIINIPSFVVYKELESGRLKQILPEYNEPGYFIYALYPHSRRLSAKTRIFLDFLVEKFQQTPYWSIH